MARPTGPIISVQHRLFSAPLGDPLRCVEYSGVLREEVEPGDQRAVRRVGPRYGHEGMVDAEEILAWPAKHDSK